MLADASTTVTAASQQPSPDPAHGTAALKLDFQPDFKVFAQHGAGRVPVGLQWEKLTFSIKSSTKCGFGPGKEKLIIAGVSGRALPGEVLALMGPSGAGKTTLLNILAGRLRKRRTTKLQGSLKVNGKTVEPTTFRKTVAFVPQHDALFATQTARESLEFSARMRMDPKVPAEEREKLVDDMLESLGLTRVQNTMVGNELIRGLSGGERKRVAIGIELVSFPQVLFLDEPTTGLDSFSAWKAVRVLRAIAGLGCTIIASIHQPSSEVFNEFSSVYLLARGHVIFQGPLSNIDHEFRRFKMGVPRNTNIADHIMLQAQTCELSQLPSDDDDSKRGPMPEYENGASVPAAAPTLARLMSLNWLADDLVEGKPKVNIGVQAYWLCEREIKSLKRDTAGLLGRFGGTGFLCVIFSVVFLGVGDQSKSTYTVNSHFGGLLQVVLQSLFGAAMPALLVFPFERIVFIRERATNTYSAPMYLFAKLLVELPLSLVQAIFTYLICYWAMHLNGNFMQLASILWLSTMATVSLAFILGSLVADPTHVQQLAPIVLVPQIVFLGFFINIDQIPYWLQWVQYIVSAKYTMNLSMLVEFDPSLAINNKIKQEWAQLLVANDVYSSRLGLYIGILVALFVGFRIVALINLMRVDLAG